jgi:hypothetical protein
LLDVIHTRDQNGFTDLDEEGFSRELASVAFFEIGEYDKSNEQIERMKSKPELTIRAAITEAHIARIDKKSKNEIIDIYKSALIRFPDNVEILTKLVTELQPVNHENAADMIRIINTISENGS